MLHVHNSQKTVNPRVRFLGSYYKWAIRRNKLSPTWWLVNNDMREKTWEIDPFELFLPFWLAAAQGHVFTCMLSYAGPCVTLGSSVCFFSSSPAVYMDMFRSCWLNLSWHCWVRRKKKQQHQCFRHSTKGWLLMTSPISQSAFSYTKPWHLPKTFLL